MQRRYTILTCATHPRATSICYVQIKLLTLCPLLQGLPSNACMCNSSGIMCVRVLL